MAETRSPVINTPACTLLLSKKRWAQKKTRVAALGIYTVAGNKRYIKKRTSPLRRQGTDGFSLIAFVKAVALFFDISLSTKKETI